jgi:hypothetical protein
MLTLRRMLRHSLFRGYDSPEIGLLWSTMEMFKLSLYRWLIALFGVAFGLSVATSRTAAQSILITNLPAYGATGYLGGYVTNANVTTNCLVVFIYVAGEWYSKPGCADQLVAIHADGSWTANITPNANDVTATEIAVFLVPTNYDLPCLNGVPGLTNVSTVEATAYAVRVNPGSRELSFSSYGWWVRTSSGNLSGPGPNYFSDSTNNAWVDAQGCLHLQITQTNNTWQCVEIITDRSFGYGQYRFTVSAPVDSLDPSAVLGMFTWSYDNAYNDREIDMELSRWNYGFGTTNVEDFAVAPYNTGQVLRFSIPAGVTNSTHSFIWQSTNVAFQTLNGNFASPPASSNLLQTWNCALGIPPAGGEQVHINLWLNQGNAPVNGHPVEVILSQFEFVPLGSPQPAQLDKINGLPGGPVEVSVQGLTDWHYQIFSSSNLWNWKQIGVILATNNQFQFTDTNPVCLTSLFYETVTEP